MPTEKALAVLADLNARLRAAFPGKVQEVVLHGSQLTGKAHDDSDYDFIVVWNGDALDWKQRRAVNDVSFETALAMDVFPDVHTLSTAEFDTPRGWQPFFTDALESGLRAA